MQELRLVLERMRVTFARVRRAPTRAQVVGLFSDTVSDSQSFPYLAGNCERWLKFIGRAIDRNNDVGMSFTLGDRANRSKPALVYDEYRAWLGGRERDTIRQTISRLKP